jgi:hypothetical protein
VSQAQSEYDRALAGTRDASAARGLELAREAAATDPDDPRIASMVAFYEWQTRTIDASTAIERLRALHAAHPSDADIAGDLAFVLFATGERGGGLRLAEDVVVAHPEDARSWRRLAWMQAVELRYPESWESYRRSIELEPLSNFFQRVIAYGVARKAHDREAGARSILDPLEPLERLCVRLSGRLSGPVVVAVDLLSIALVAAGVAIWWPFAVVGVALGAGQLLGVDRSVRGRAAVWLAYLWIVVAVATIAIRSDSTLSVVVLFVLAASVLPLGRVMQRGAPMRVGPAATAAPDPATKATRLALLGGSFITMMLTFAPWYRQCVFDFFCVQGAGVPEGVVTLAFVIACVNLVWSFLRFAEPRPRLTYERRAMVSFTLSAMSAGVSAAWLFVPDIGTDTANPFAALLPGLERTPWGWICLAVSIVVAGVAAVDLRRAAAYGRSTSSV